MNSSVFDKVVMNHDVQTKIQGRVHSLNFIVKEVLQYKDNVILFEDINMKHRGVSFKQQLSISFNLYRIRA